MKREVKRDYEYRLKCSTVDTGGGLSWKKKSKRTMNRISPSSLVRSLSMDNVYARKHAG